MGFCSLYLVRIVETKEILGIFYALDVDDLAWDVDEFVNPNACEYVELDPNFSMVWLRNGTPKKPKGYFEDDDYEDWDFDGMSFGEHAQGFFADLEEDVVEFTPIEFTPDY